MAQPNYFVVEASFDNIKDRVGPGNTNDAWVGVNVDAQGAASSGLIVVGRQVIQRDQKVQLKLIWLQDLGLNVGDNVGLSFGTKQVGTAIILEARCGNWREQPHDPEVPD